MDNKLQYWIELNRVKLFYKIRFNSKFFSPSSQRIAAIGSAEDGKCPTSS